jgi:hypothetical protein
MERPFRRDLTGIDKGSLEVAMATAFMTTSTVPFPGKEQKALEFAAQSVEFWSKQAAEDRCTEPEWFFFPNGVGHLMVKGDRADLEEVLNSDEGRRLMRRGLLLLEGWQFALGDTGTGAERFLAEYVAELSTA